MPRFFLGVEANLACLRMRSPLKKSDAVRILILHFQQWMKLDSLESKSCLGRLSFAKVCLRAVASQRCARMP